MKKKYKAILFDFDGTIVDLGVDWLNVRSELSEFFLENRLKWNNSDTLFNNITRSYQYLKNNLDKKEKADSFLNRAFDIVKKREISNIDKAKPIQGVRNLLNWLKKRGIAVAIVSNNDSKTIRKCLQKFNLPPPVKIISRDMVSSYKPNKEPALKALEALQMKVKDCMYVGNSKIDRELGRALKIKTLILSEDISNLLEIKKHVEGMP